MASERVGRAVLELTTDGGSFFTGIEQAKTKMRSLGATIKAIQADASRMATSLSGRPIIAEATKLTNVIRAVGGAERLTASERARANTTVAEAIAKYQALGRQAPQAMLDLERATRRVEAPTQTLTTRMVALGSAVGSFVGNIAYQAISRGASALAGMAKEAFEAGGRFTDLRSKTGLSTDTLQRMDFVAKQTGTTLDAMGQASFMLGVRVASASHEVKAGADSLAKYGVSWKSIKDLDQEELWKRVTDALSKTNDAHLRNSAGVALFGRSFAEISPAIQQGYAQIANAARVSSQQQLEALDRANDRWSAFKTDFNNGVTSMLGRLLLWNDAWQQAKEQAGGNLSDFIATFKRLRQEQENTDINLPAQAPPPTEQTESYVRTLAKVRAELARLTPAQRAEIAAAQQLGVDTDKLEDKYGLTAGALRVLTAETKELAKALDITKMYPTLTAALAATRVAMAHLTADQRANIKAGVELGESTDDIAIKLHLAKQVVDAFATSIKNAEKFEQDLETTNIEVTASIYSHFREMVEKTQSEQLEQIKTLPNARFQAGQMATETAIRQAEAEIEQAKRTGVAWQQVYAMERDLSSAKLQAAKADAQEQFRVQTQDVRARLAKTENFPDRSELDAQTAIFEQTIAQMDADFNIGEAEKQDAIRRTYNVWVRAWDQMRSTSEGTIGAVAANFAKMENETVGKLGTILFGFGHDESGDLKRAAADARLQYLHIANSGKATAEELGLAFRRWHEAEDRANYTFGERFKDVWRSVKSTIQDILNDVLKYFTEQFLVGLIKGISGAKLGQQLGGALAAGMPMAGGGGGLTSGLVQGGLNSVNPLGGNQNSLLRLLGIGGGGGGVATTGAGAAATLGTSAGVAAGAGAGAVVVPPTFLAGAPAFGATGGGVVAGSTAPATAGASLASLFAGPAAGGLVGGLVGYKTGSKTLGVLSGAATGAAVGAMFGGPIGAGIGAGVGALAGLIGGILGGKGKANKIRDQFLAQFAAFDGKHRDPNNPPGFFGLDTLLTKYKKHDLFKALIAAKKPKDVKQAEQPIATFMATLGRTVKVFHRGGVIDDEPMNSRGEVLIKALRGESVLTPDATQSIGGRPAVDALNAQPAVAKAAGAAIGGLFSGTRASSAASLGGLFGLFRHHRTTPAMPMPTAADGDTWTSGSMGAGTGALGGVSHGSAPRARGAVHGLFGVFHDGGVIGDEAGDEIGGSSTVNALNALKAAAKARGHIGGLFSRLFHVGKSAPKATAGSETYDAAAQADGWQNGSFGAMAAQMGQSISARVSSVMNAARVSMPQLQMPMLAPAGPRMGLMPLAASNRDRQIEVHYHDNTKHTWQVWDGEDAKRAYQRHIRPAMKEDIALNRSQLASIIKRSIED